MRTKQEKKEYAKKYYQKNKEKLLLRVKKYQENKKEELKKYQKKYNKIHKEEIKIKRQKHYQKNKKRLIEISRKYRKEHRKDRNEYRKKYREEHKEEILDYKKKYSINRRKNDINYKLRCYLSGRIWSALKGTNKSAHTMELVGCSIEFLKVHLEKQFTKGMSWKNYGLNGWEVDHIKPCASFDLTKSKQQRKCFNYKNLQPLWALENRSKGDKYNA